MISVSFDSEKLLKELQEYHKEAVRKMQGMVTTFAYNVTLSAIKFTPIGAYDEGTERYKEFYHKRQEMFGLSPREGFAKGSWSVDDVLNQSSMTNTEGFYGRESGSNAAEKVFFDDLNKYRLGKDLYITNTGPYIDQLEKNWSEQTQGQGIVQPTIDDVQSVYQQDLVKYYNSDQ